MRNRMDRKITVFIEGLDCEDEAKIIRAKMQGLKGVVYFEVNTMAGSMNATFDGSLISPVGWARPTFTVTPSPNPQSKAGWT